MSTITVKSVWKLQIPISFPFKDEGIKIRGIKASYCQHLQGPFPDPWKDAWKTVFTALKQQSLWITGMAEPHTQVTPWWGHFYWLLQAEAIISLEPDCPLPQVIRTLESPCSTRTKIMTNQITVWPRLLSYAYASPYPNSSSIWT
jgi:hypothetical protein